MALDLEENKDLLKKVALRIQASCFLDTCFPEVTLVPFVPAMYRSQSEVLKTLDWQNENGKVLYWQVSPLSFGLEHGYRRCPMCRRRMPILDVSYALHYNV